MTEGKKPQNSNLPPLAEVTDVHRHYGEFYRLKPVRPSTTNSSLPRVAVIGNCQGESLRILLASSGAVDSFRIPPVHEWTASDLEYVRATIAETDVLISQPIRDNYRNLPCGTAQLAKYLPAHGRLITYPVLRFNALNPYIAIIRSPNDPSLNPPVVPYHNLAYVAEFAGLKRVREVDYQACARQSISQLATREQAHNCVKISDTLAPTPVWHILNHPNNATLIELARRVLREITPDLSQPTLDAVTADHELLGHLQSPIDPAAAEFFGVKVRRPVWTLGGEEISEHEIYKQQMAFYRDHPEVVEAGLARHQELLHHLGYDVAHPADPSATSLHRESN
ncbi:MAG: WcbI family polysaccharide biosynthesis putative acetyltransferase [Rothia sp. (in: high G+C Gram-positive bacteria)]|nr:WcbI family polysaccharide biosynthesis putative acetyltransferase [Rothia sp. (in: high G+C Gram-positive bacteria)]